MTDEPHVDFASFARDSTSQAGENGVVAALLARLPVRDCWCVEFGAWDGAVASNTYDLVNEGYSAVLIEGDPDKFRQLERRFAQRADVSTLCAMVGWEGPAVLDKLLVETPIPSDFDLLSIDIDGNDFHVWQAVRAYRPKIVVIEFNPTIANGIEFVQEARADVHQGASISSLARMGTDKGYELVACTEFNAFFVRVDLFPAFGLADNSVERLRTDTSWQSHIFFGFDGRAVIQGGKGLYWHGGRVPDVIRMVPRPLVGWPGDFGRIRRGALKAYRAWTYLRYRDGSQR